MELTECGNRVPASTIVRYLKAFVMSLVFEQEMRLNRNEEETTEI